ncbi:MAG: 23S rRNA (guanosine(2251)-2'-O)-methyltransferase RlmB [Gammaproteobacteria bacterium]|nr:23S rRNA (guanosine(2251)-2'-O)-methyltransferase RlmB [Gammaproteobacteria bacterium]
MSEQNLVYGLHAVEALLKNSADSVLSLMVMDGRRDERLNAVLQLAKAAGLNVAAVPKAELDKRCGGGRHQGVLALVRGEAPKLSENELGDYLANLGVPPFVLVLDGVTDPHNLGACLRTADAAGVHAVLVPKDRSASLTPVVRKVACGAAEAVPLIQVTNLARALRELKDAGLWIVGTAGEADDELYAADLRGPLALVMGAEGAGMRRLTKEHCDALVKLPMAGTVSSLNVSVATGVCLYEAVRQRRS